MTRTHQGWGQAVWTHLLLPSPLHPSLLDWEQGSPGHWGLVRWGTSRLPEAACLENDLLGGENRLLSGGDSPTGWPRPSHKPSEPAHLGFHCRSRQDPLISSLLPGHFANYLLKVLNGMSAPCSPSGDCPKTQNPRLTELDWSPSLDAFEKHPETG